MKFKNIPKCILTASIALTLIGCGSDSEKNTPPSIQVSSSIDVKENKDLSITATVTDNSVVTGITWEQISGPALALSGQSTPTVSFIAPAVDADTDVVLRVTATDDSTESSSKEVTVSLLNNRTPVVNASFTDVLEKSAAVLSLSASDDDGAVVSHMWEQTAGPSVVIANSETSQISFTAPTISEDTVLTFKMTVTDDNGESTIVEQSVTIKSIDVDYVLSGTINSDKFSNAAVSASFLEQNFTTTADESGVFNFTFSADDDETNLFARVNASSIQNSALEYSAFLSQLTVSEQQTPNSSNSVSLITSQMINETDGNSNTVSLSSVSTALVALITAANEGVPPTDLESFSLVEKGVEPDVLIEAAAVVKYVTENEIALPEGTDNLLDLIEDPQAYNELITQVEESDPGAIARTVDEIIADPELTPPVDAASLPNYYVRTFPTAKGFLSRGGEKFTFNSDNTGKQIHFSGANDYRWQLSEGVITLDFTGGNGKESYYSVDVGTLGLTQEQVDQLFSAGIYQVEVIINPVSGTLTRVLEGETIDSYRMALTSSHEMTPVYVGDQLIQAPPMTVETESDISFKKPFTNEKSFSMDDIDGTWAIQHYSDVAGRFILDPLVINSDNTGKLQDNGAVFTWDINSDGILRAISPDNQYQEFQIIDQLNDELQILSVAYSDTGNVKAAEVMYGFKVDKEAAKEIAVEVEQGMYWQTMVNQWSKGNWNDGKLEFYYEGILDVNNFNMFGFSLTSGYSMNFSWLTGTPEDYEISGPEVKWEKTGANVSINYFSAFACSDDMTKSCRIREWEVLKSSPGVAGERLYVKEKYYSLLDDRFQFVSTGEPSIIFEPRLNVYEKISEDYWRPDTTPSSVSNAKKNTKRVILSPNKTASTNY